MCASPGGSLSWLRGVHYDAQVFDYRECPVCHSLSCAPPPGDATLRRMYGVNYAADVAPGAGGEGVDPKHPEWVLEALRGMPAGTFVDYGCGGGALLLAARQMGWRAVGVEFDPEVASQVQQATGVRVCTAPAPELAHSADVVHLGDVIEHLVHLERDFQGLLTLLKPGGCVIAQGPLENNFTIFSQVVCWARGLRATPVHMAPYHVLLATSRGQRRFFERFGLQPIDYRLTEETWPAPARWRWAPRGAALYLLRWLSKAGSRLLAKESGNRFFYVGRMTEEGARGDTRGAHRPPDSANLGRATR